MKLIVSAAFVAALAVAAPAFGAPAIATNGTVKGRLQKGDAKIQKYFWGDHYTYEAQAGEEVWIVWKNLTPGLDAQTEVRGPGGFLLTGPTGMNARSVVFPRAGRYTITIWDGDPGDYEMTVHRLETGPANTRLSAGQQLRGAFAAADVDSEGTFLSDTLTYTARAGETAMFHFEGQSDFLMLKVLSPEKGFIGGSGVSTDGKALDVGANFPKAGDYTIKVYGRGGNYLVDARSKLPAEQAPATPLKLGETVQLRYSPDGAVDRLNAVVDVYELRAERGQSLAVLRPSRLRVSVRGPDGKILLTRDSSNQVDGPWVDSPYLASTEFTAPVAGAYRIEAQVAPDMKPADTGLQVVPASDAAARIASGKAANSALVAKKREAAAASLRRGEQLMNSGDNQGAIMAFLEAMGHDNTDTQLAITANFGAGLAAYRQGGSFGYLSAKGYFESVLIHDPNNAAAKYNRDLAAQADADFQRNQQVAYEQAQAQRRQENAQYFSNMLNAFAMGVNLGNQINAANAPPPPAPAPAPAAPMPAAEPAAQQTARAGSTGCGQPGMVYYYGAPNCTGSNQKTHNPANDGTNCVRVVPNPGNWGSAAYFFVNGCGWPVEVAWDRNSQGRYTSMTTIPLGGHYPTGFAKLPSPFPYIACKKRPDIGADIYNDNGRHICVGPAA